MFRIIKHKNGGLCQAHGCGNKRTERDNLCPKHRHRYNKENNPENYTYHLLKANARRRGHSCSLTLEEFKEFCKDTGYMDLKGRRPLSASIDRIDPNKGYEKGNIQIMSLRDNAVKQHTDKDCPF